MYVTTLYEQILGRGCPSFRETPAPKMECLTERHLQAIWMEQRYFRDLKTHDGLPIQVVSPGIWNAEAGPDFLKAHLRIGDEDVFGDVEIHLSDCNWHQHRHDQDPRYDRVALHVSFWEPANETVIFTNSGKAIPRTYLEPKLTISLKRILQLVDLDLYPYRKFVGSGRCAVSLFRHSNEIKTRKILSSAAMWRLERKRQFLYSDLHDDADALLCGMAMALGYRANADVFKQLYLWLRQQPSKDFDTLLALAMGVTGFFKEPFVTRWQESVEYRRILKIWEGQEKVITTSFTLVVGQTRPLNHPVRRLVALCKMVLDPGLPGLYDRCLSLWNARWSECRKAKDLTRLRSDLLELMPSYEDRYWSNQYLFESKVAKEPISLIGEDLQKLFLVNSFLPLLNGYILINYGTGDQADVFEDFYGAFSSSASGKREYLVHRFFGEMTNGNLLRKSIYEQGAFQIHNDFCVHYESSCEGCPFVDRVRDACDPV
ncbi:MAG: DUF2851 family protein [Chlamydiales bacterium]|nr:DUF2851 family protein [Chlamydiales bacterium]